MKKNIMKINLKVTSLTVIVTVILSIGFSACKQTAQEKQGSGIAQTEEFLIVENEVLQAQLAWGEGIVKIGEVYINKGDFKEAATRHINNFYNYQEGIVLFKPTLVSQKQFRLDFEGALSYFIGGDDKYPEDHGFAIKPWSSVRWENAGIKISRNIAIAMGNYYFTPVAGGEEVKVEYSFAYVKDRKGKLKIILHDSHIPYSTADKH